MLNEADAPQNKCQITRFSIGFLYYGVSIKIFLLPRALNETFKSPFKAFSLEQLIKHERDPSV
jgi:hypothetical protein